MNIDAGVYSRPAVIDTAIDNLVAQENLGAGLPRPVVPEKQRTILGDGPPCGHCQSPTRGGVCYRCGHTNHVSTAG